MWKQQILSAVKGYKLHHFLTGDIIPDKYDSEEDRRQGIVTQTYQN